MPERGRVLFPLVEGRVSLLVVVVVVLRMGCVVVVVVGPESWLALLLLRGACLAWVPVHGYLVGGLSWEVRWARVRVTPAVRMMPT